MHASYCTESCRNSCSVDGNQPMIYIILFYSLAKTIYMDKNLEKVIMKKLFPFSCINFLILKLNQGRESIERPPCCSQDQVASFTLRSAEKLDKATKCLFLLRRSKYTFLSPYVGTTYQSCSQPYFQHVKKFLYKQTPGMSCGVLPSFLILKGLYISKKKKKASTCIYNDWHLSSVNYMLRCKKHTPAFKSIIWCILFILPFFF